MMILGFIALTIAFIVMDKSNERTKELCKKLEESIERDKECDRWAFEDLGIIFDEESKSWRKIK